MKDNADRALDDLKSKKLHTYTVAELCAKYKVLDPVIRGRARTRGLLKLFRPAKPGTKPIGATPTEDLTAEVRFAAKVRQHKDETKVYKERYEEVLDQLNDQERIVAEALALSKYRPKMIQIEPRKSNEKSEATAVSLLSDVHLEEIIAPHKVNYLNEHNPEISKRRVMRFFELAMNAIRSDRQDNVIENWVLWLGGDFFTNEAHDAPIAFPPITAAMVAQDYLFSGLSWVRTQEPNLKIHIIGSVGNHSRIQIQKPVNQASEQEHSLEWMMYHALKNQFAADKMITWQLDNSYHTYAKVYDKTIRFNHGHLGWRYSDGLAGVHGPLWKVITQKWDKQIKADLTCCGHYHTYTPASRARQYIVNGSTVGASAYGLQFGFEEPIQAHFLVHKKYGIVAQRPLFVNS